MLSLEEMKELINSKKFKQETKKNIEREPERIKNIWDARESANKEPDERKAIMDALYKPKKMIINDNKLRPYTNIIMLTTTENY